MTEAVISLIATYLIAILILVGAFVLFVLNPPGLPRDFITGIAGIVVGYVFRDVVAKQSAADKS